MQIISILETLELLFVIKDFVQAGKIFNGSIHEGRRGRRDIEERGIKSIGSNWMMMREGGGWNGTPSSPTFTTFFFIFLLGNTLKVTYITSYMVLPYKIASSTLVSINSEIFGELKCNHAVDRLVNWSEP